MKDVKTEEEKFQPGDKVFPLVVVKNGIGYCSGCGDGVGFVRDDGFIEFTSYCGCMH